MTLLMCKRLGRSIAGTCFTAAVFLFLTDSPAFSQTADPMIERRVEALENYVSTFQPTLIEVSDNLNRSIQQYTQDLEASLEDYSKKMQQNLDERLDRLTRNTVVLNPFSDAYQSIETGTGTFLVAIDKTAKIEDGVKLYVNIGNPNFADYNGFTLRFIWGKKWGGEFSVPYEEWRQSLRGVEVAFNGKLEKGKWNSLTVDLTPVGEGELGYLECEMDVKSVELGVKSR